MSLLHSRVQDETAAAKALKRGLRSAGVPAPTKGTATVRAVGEGTGLGRRRHNEAYLKWFLDVGFPDSAPGSPPREQNYDANKPGSRVILRKHAYDRLMHEEGSRSYFWILGLIAEACTTTEHHLMSRYVLLNVNTAGGYSEMQRLEELSPFAPEAKIMAKKCREIVKHVLDELDERDYWLGMGFGVDVSKQREAAVDRRKAGVLATEVEALEAICAYYELMRALGYGPGEAERATCQHFQCGTTKLRKATRELRERERQRQKEKAS